EDLRQVGGPVQRHTYRPALVRQRRQNRLSDPPDGVRDELHPLLRIELPGGGDESDIPLLDQIGEADAAILILLRDRDDEAEVGANQLLDRGFIASLGTTTELDLFRGGQEPMGADLLQVLIEAGLILGRDRVE